MTAPLPLRCPVTSQSLHIASTDELARINQFIESDPSCLSSLEQVEGTKISHPLDKAWINQSNTHAYIDQDNLPILIPDAAIVMEMP